MVCRGLDVVKQCTVPQLQDLNRSSPGRRPKLQPDTAHFGPEKRPPEAIFGGQFWAFLVNYRAFFMRCRRFFWLFGQLQCIFRRLGEVDSAHGKFLAPKETNKNERIKKILSIFDATSTETRTLSTRYSTYSAQCKFVYSTRPFQ